MSIISSDAIKYLEIDSTYRDRNNYPNPGDFEVYYINNKEKEYSLDPYTEYYPIIEFTSSLLENTNESVVNGLEICLDLSPDINDIYKYFYDEDPGSVIICRIKHPNKFIKKKNFYVGCGIKGIPYDKTELEYSKISSYDFLFEYSDGVDMYDVGKFRLSNRFSNVFLNFDNISIYNTSINDPINTSNAYIFIPNGINIENYYIDCIIEDVSINENLKIISYDSFLKICKLETTFSNLWDINDRYTIRKYIPYEKGNIESISNIKYKAEFLVSNIDDYYNNSFIRINDVNSILYNETRRIIGYNSIDKIITINEKFSSDILVPISCELLNFSRDTFNPIKTVYNKDNYVLYEMELINIIVPNKLLDIKGGGYPKDYPYLMIELENVSIVGNNRYTLISNNPNTSKVIFIAPIDDTTNLNVCNFIKFDGNGMRQIIKFKPDQSMKVTIKLPNGEIFKTLEKDTISPKIVNEQLQISICISIVPINKK